MALRGDCGARELAHDAALGHDQHAVAQIGQFVRLRTRSTSTAMPLVGEAADQAVDLGAGADVDAAGRLVEDEHARRAREPAADDDLLLVAAAQAPDRRLEPRRS